MPPSKLTMIIRQATILIGLLATATAFAPSSSFSSTTTTSSRFSPPQTTVVRSTTQEADVDATKKNVEQTEDTSREKVMTFSYDMSLEQKYEKPTYPGTGNGMSGGESGEEYDVIVIGSGMGGLTCGALSAKYGSKVLVLESHIKVGGSAHTFTRIHNAEM